MKNSKIISFIFALFVIALCITNTNKSTTIITTKKILYSGNEQVSHRELALAAGLSYLDVPSICGNLNTSLYNYCKGVLDHANIKMNLGNYADINEMEGWETIDSTSEGTGLVVPSLITRLFTASTLKKGNNIIIVFRGTDFIDAMEWIQDIQGGLLGVNPQESSVEQYVLEIGKMLTTDEKYKNEKYNIYITGHSLGGYLTQIAASTLEKAIQNGKEGKNDWDGWNLLNQYESPKDFSYYKDLNFVQAVYFNGIGMNVFSTSNFDIFDSDKEGKQNKKIEILKKLGNDTSNEESKLIGYFTEGDIVSSLGIHYGENRGIESALDTVSSYKRLFDTVKQSVPERANQLFKVLTLKNILTEIAEQKLTKVDITKIYDDKYNIGSIVGSIVMTHKLDSMMCFLDSETNVDRSVRIVKKERINSIPYFGDMLSEEQSEIVSNEPITLIATTSNACARQYIWYEVDPVTKKEKKLFSSNKTNEYTIKDQNKLKYIKVKAIYNDSYQSNKYIETIDSYNYEKKRVVLKTGDISSNVIAVMYDTKSPTCSVANIPVGVLYNTCSASFDLNCKDNYKMNKVILGNFTGALKNNLEISISNLNNTDKYIVNLKAKMITLGNQSLTLKDISDKAGNVINSSITPKISLNINENLFIRLGIKKCN